MSKVVVTGSLAYDHIMTFPGLFREHILPDKVHMLNVAFPVDDIARQYGGTAGNIAYNLSMLKVDHTVLAALGEDGNDYLNYLAEKQVNVKGVKTFQGKWTAQAYIMTDRDDNQITAFHAGAMEQANQLSLLQITLRPQIVVVAPNAKLGMLKYLKEAKENKIVSVFTPGQQITSFNGAELETALGNTEILIVNDYEFSLILDKVGWQENKLLEKVKLLVITKGSRGSIIRSPDLDMGIEIPVAKPREVIDPTGCGDAYIAGFIYGLLHKLSWEVVGRMAALTAVYAVEKKGTQNHTFTIGEFKKRYRENFGEQLDLVNEV